MNSKTGRYALFALAIIVGLFFAFTGAKKLFTDWEWGKQSYLRYHPLWVYYASGVVELVCGLGLIPPITRFASSICMLVMIVAVAIHPWQGDWRPIVLPAGISTALLVFIAWASRPRAA